MIEFWKDEATIAGKLVRRLPPETLQATSNPIAEMMGRLSGTLLNYEKLVWIGLPGLRKEIQAGRRQNGDLPLYTGMQMALDLLDDIINGYAKQVRGLAAAAKDETDERDYREMAAVLEAILSRPPETLREAIQLTWLYTMILRNGQLRPHGCVPGWILCCRCGQRPPERSREACACCSRSGS